MAPRKQGGKRLALVVGGAGFLGKHVVQQLLVSGRYSVRVFDIRDCGVPGAEMVLGDIRRLQVSACARVFVRARARAVERCRRRKGRVCCWWQRLGGQRPPGAHRRRCSTPPAGTRAPGATHTRAQ
jgi:hypothetical protein